MPTEVDVSKVRFAPLEEAHIARILEIEKISHSAPWSERSFRNELTNSQSRFTVATLGGEVVGYGGMWLCVDEAHITTVAVKPELRRHGIGKRIMLQLLYEAKEEGMTCSTLEVRAGNEAAIKLYENLGYKSTAYRKNYYPDNKEDAVVMWLYELQEWEA